MYFVLNVTHLFVLIINQLCCKNERLFTKTGLLGSFYRHRLLQLDDNKHA